MQTVRNHAESTREELLRLRRAVDASGEIIFLTDRQGLITFVNPEFTRVYGYTGEEVVGKNTPRILRSGGLTRDEYQRFWAALLNKQVLRIDITNRAKDGRLIVVEGTASPILDERGGIIGFLAIQRDVTERRKVEERHQLAQFALDRAADAIFWIRSDGTILYANDAATRMFGYSHDTLCSMTAADLDPDPSQKGFAQHVWEGVRRGSTRFESSPRREDGVLVPVDVTVSYLELAGQMCGCAIVRDLTERKRLEEQFRQAQKMEAVGRLAGGIAHDFNNLLTAILGYGEVLADRIEGQPRLAAPLEQIVKAGERAARLTRQLLAFSRRQVLEPQVLNPAAIIRDLEKMLGRLIGEDVKLVTVVGPSVGRVEADRSQIEQILMNLAVNARDAMPSGGTLRIELANATFGRGDAPVGVRPGRYVSFRISDTGDGINEDVLPNIFEPFFTTKPDGVGTGLGLSTVYGIVKQSGGAITVDSKQHAGTAFTIYLPQVDDVPDSAQSPAPPRANLNGSETVLVAEDEPALRNLIRYALEQRGYTVLEGVDSRAVVEVARIQPGPIHLLLSDVVMPDLGGPAVAQRIVAFRPDIRVLYVSGFPITVETDRLSSHAAILLKPFTPDTLVRKVRECLDRVEQRN